MNLANLFLIAALPVALVAAWTDWRTGHIPNWLTYGALGIAPVAHFAVAVATGHSDVALEEAGMSVLGALACSVVPLLMYRAKGLFGGDLKLLAALGAICGPAMGVETQLFAFIVATTWAFGRLAYDGKLWSTLGNTLSLVANPLRKADKRRELTPEMMTEMRFGPALLGGLLIEIFSRLRGA